MLKVLLIIIKSELFLWGQNVSLAWFSVIQCLMLTTALQFFQSQENLNALLAVHEKYFLQSRYMKTPLNKFSYISKNTLHTQLMKFWEQDIQVSYLLRLNPSNNSPNDFEQYSTEEWSFPLNNES